jgi:hypothetical protein
MRCAAAGRRGPGEALWCRWARYGHSVAENLDPDRVLNWCIALAGMAALEAASTPGVSSTYVDPLVTLAERAPTT